MAEAAVHRAACLLIALIGAFPMAMMYDGWHSLIFSIACTIGERYLSPDLDDSHGDTPYKRWGPLRFIWYPYHKCITHRSPISHWPILGTASRVVYLSIIALPALLHYDVEIADALVRHETIAIAVMTGLEASNSTHWLFDTVLK